MKKGMLFMLLNIYDDINLVKKKLLCESDV